MYKHIKIIRLQDNITFTIYRHFINTVINIIEIIYCDNKIDFIEPVS